MKQLKNYIIEKLHIKKYKKEYKYHPKDRDELIKIIGPILKEKGFNADLNDIDVSQVKNMSDLFINCKFNGDISEWDVSNVEDMSGMFWNSEFNGDISHWNVKNVKNMRNIFHNCPLEKNPPAWFWS